VDGQAHIIRPLFGRAGRFTGLPADGFGLFTIPDRGERRQAIRERIHPALSELAADLHDVLTDAAAGSFHVHLPRLDWPRDYEPFCTWVVLSTLDHGYQAGPQINVGVHADHVAVRLGWDTSADAFGRFEFLARHGALGPMLRRAAEEAGLAYRAYATAPWPVGSRRIFESPDDYHGSFDAVRRAGVWWELGRRWDLPQALPLVASPSFLDEARRVVEALLPPLLRATGRRR